MIFALELGPEFKRTVSEMSESGVAVRAAASEGIAEGVVLTPSKSLFNGVLNRF